MLAARSVVFALLAVVGFSLAAPVEVERDLVNVGPIDLDLLDNLCLGKFGPLLSPPRIWR